MKGITPPAIPGYVFWSNYGLGVLNRPGFTHTHEELQHVTASEYNIPFDDVLVTDHPLMIDELRFAVYVREKHADRVCRRLSLIHWVIAAFLGDDRWQP